MDAFGAGGYLGVTQLSAILPRLADERPDKSAGNLVITRDSSPGRCWPRSNVRCRRR
jgi:hypothetical protein